MKLRTLIKQLDYIKLINFKNVKITALEFNSKEIIAGAMFFCIRGGESDGHVYAVDAIGRGAACIICEEAIDGVDVPQIVVRNTRRAMSQIAKVFFGSFCERLKIVTVVGTNGKTSTTYILNHILTVSGYKSAIIGTNGAIVGGLSLPSKLTTPDPIELHYLFKQLYNLGVEVVVMEASAHALHLHKMYGIVADIGIFTNITPEHLDYFGTFEKYKYAKTSYFTRANCKSIVTNVDDAAGLELISQYDGVIASYGLNNPATAFALDITTSLSGSKFVANVFDNIMQINTKLSGVYNVYNILAAMNAGFMLGCQAPQVEKAMNTFAGIPGRLNVFSFGNNKNIIIDYAHTPDAVEKIMETVHDFKGRGIITVFGCVGYSLPEKRKEMGEAATKYSDYVVITSDNPGHVPFEEISKDVKSGFQKFKNYTEIADREEAIIHAFNKLQANETLVILGKGIEEYNLVGDKKVKHSDVKLTKQLILQYSGVDVKLKKI